MAGMTGGSARRGGGKVQAKELMKKRRAFSENRPVNDPKHGDISSGAQRRQGKMYQRIRIGKEDGTQKPALDRVEKSESRGRGKVKCRSSVFYIRQHVRFIEQDSFAISVKTPVAKNVVNAPTMSKQDLDRQT